MNELFRALQGMGASANPDAHIRPQLKPLELDWRGKSVRLLTPDEVVAFANEMRRQQDRLREERDGYLGRAITAEAEAALKPNYDTREERDMDLGINGRRSYCGED